MLIVPAAPPLLPEEPFPPPPGPPPEPDPEGPNCAPPPPPALVTGDAVIHDVAPDPPTPPTS